MHSMLKILLILALGGATVMSIVFERPGTAMGIPLCSAGAWLGQRLAQARKLKPDTRILCGFVGAVIGGVATSLLRQHFFPGPSGE